MAVVRRPATQVPDPDAENSYQPSLPATANNALRLQRDPLVYQNTVAKYDSITEHTVAMSESNTTGPEVGVNTRVLQKSAFFSSPISPYMRQTTSRQSLLMPPCLEPASHLHVGN
nr:hypothetical transcript [Hymenolepis microstoma]